jgi:hypothetical protein
MVGRAHPTSFASGTTLADSKGMAFPTSCLGIGIPNKIAEQFPDEQQVYEAAHRENVWKKAKMGAYTNAWVHVATTYEGMEQVLYKDGVELYRRDETGKILKKSFGQKLRKGYL